MALDPIKRFAKAQNSLVVQHSDFSLRALHDMAVSKTIDLDPHYQRRDRWKPDRQSALIESFILNVPVPPVYLSEDDFGKYSVIDGKQRITSIRDFLSNTLTLTGLKRFHELEGCTFTTIPIEIQNALSVRPYIRVITLLKQTDPQLKYEVFLRLNTGGEKLLPQEIRNVAYSGTLNDLLFRLSETPFLWNRLKIKGHSSTGYRKMEDVEHVLRFFTISERWRHIGQVPSEEMDDFMRQNRNPSQNHLRSLEKKFLFSLQSCELIWGKHAFCKPQAKGWRDQFISPLYDAEMTACTLFSQQQMSRIIKNRTHVVKEFARQFNEDDEFRKSASQSTNNPASVKNRISTTHKILNMFA